MAAQKPEIADKKANMNLRVDPALKELMDLEAVYKRMNLVDLASMAMWEFLKNHRDPRNYLDQHAEQLMNEQTRLLAHVRSEAKTVTQPAQNTRESVFEAATAKELIEAALSKIAELPSNESGAGGQRQ